MLLHLALDKCAISEVVVLVLKANPNATTSKDEARLTMYDLCALPHCVRPPRSIDPFRIASCHTEWTAAAAPRHYAGRFRGGGDSAAQRE